MKEKNKEIETVVENEAKVIVTSNGDIKVNTKKLAHSEQFKRFGERSSKLYSFSVREKHN